MQKLKYYVLWKKNSWVISYYLDKYYLKLVSDLKILSKTLYLREKINELLSIENKEFILSPDQSSVINLLYLEKIKNISSGLDIKKYENKFEEELDLFLAWKYSKLVMNMWDKIQDTKIKLTLIDNNPYWEFEAHPDHHNTWWIKWLWEVSLSNWLKIFNKTFNLLKKVDIDTYDELNQIIKKIIPFWTSKWLHNSASYKECIWHLYMGYTIDSKNPAINNLEAIIHESSHNKLNLIMQFDNLILNDKKETYYSPYRPDARHMHWVYLWVHAFIPTIYIILKAYSKWFLWDDIHLLEKLFLYYLKNKISLKVLNKYGNFTILWKEIIEEMFYVMNLTNDLISSINIPQKIKTNANSSLKKHFFQVNKNYSILKY